MADKKIVREAYSKNATELAKEPKISSLEVKTNEHGLELVAGKDAVEKLLELGFEVDGNGNMTVKAFNNDVERADNGEIIRKASDEKTQKSSKKEAEGPEI